MFARLTMVYETKRIFNMKTKDKMVGKYLTYSKNGTKLLGKAQIIARFPMGDYEFKKFIEHVRLVLRRDFEQELFYYMRGQRGYKVVENKKEALLVATPLRRDIESKQYIVDLLEERFDI